MHRTAHAAALRAWLPAVGSHRLVSCQVLAWLIHSQGSPGAIRSPTRLAVSSGLSHRALPAARETPDPSESALGEAAATSQRTHSNSPLRQITDPVAPETAVRQHSESLHPETTRSTTLSPSTSPHEHTSPPKNSSSVVDCSFQITLPVRHEIANTCPNLISFSRFICLEMSLNGTPVIDLMYIGYPGAVTRRSPIPSPSRSPVADREIERTHSWQIILRSRCQGRAPGTHGAHLPVRLAAGPAPRCFSHSAAAPRATTRARTRPAA